MKIITAIAILSIALYSCAKKITNTSTKTVAENPIKPVESPKQAVEAPKDVAVQSNDLKKEPAEVVTGKLVFESNCGRCHELKMPPTYNAEKWVKIIDWMAPKAKLDATQKENVLAYVIYYAKK